MVAILEAFVEHRVSIVFGHTFECSWLDYPKQLYLMVLLLVLFFVVLLGMLAAGGSCRRFLLRFQVAKRDTS
jgi:hypothetical protein